MVLEVYDVAVVGAGIAGSTLAALLAPHVRTLLLDRDIHGLPGSTGHASGVVPQIDAEPALTELARRSVAQYRSIPNGFDAIGGLEVVSGPGETPASLTARHALALARGVRANLLTGDEALALAPSFVRSGALGAIHYPHDGVADAHRIAAHNHKSAADAGAALVNGDVVRLQRCAQGYCLTLADGRTIKAVHVALCTGAWAGQLLPKLSSQCVSIAHPYALGHRRAPRSTENKQPFVRYAGQVSYARDHGDRDGFGTYAHAPVPTRVKASTSAYGEYGPQFTPALREAMGVLPDSTAAHFLVPGCRRVPASADSAKVREIAAQEPPYASAGLMSVTPDGKPLAGRLDHGLEGALWCVVGAQVAHAAGAAELVAPQILAAMGKDRPPVDDHWLRRAVDPLRFRGRAAEQTQEECIERYRDVWGTRVWRRSVAGVRARAKL